MDNIRAPDKEEVRKAYEAGAGSFQQLADKYNIKVGTIKSWAKRDKDSGQPWKKVATKQKTNSKKVATKTKAKNIIKEESKLEEVEEILNSELTDKQRLFCIYYIKYFNATKAAIKAGYSKETAYSQGPRLLDNVEVQKEIQKLKASKFKGALLAKEDLLQKYIDIAFADITDYVSFGRKEIEVPKDDKPVMVEVNYVDCKNSDEIDGTIISEVSQGKNGVSVKLQDKMKALDFLAKNIGLLDLETQSNLKNEEEKLKMAREKLELEKSRIRTPEEDNNQEGIKQFIEATTMKEDDVKELFKDDVDE